MINLGAPTQNSDAVTKQYVDDVSAISEGIANITVTTSGLTANQTELTNGSTPLNMNNQLITAIAAATSGTDGLNRDTADARYYLNTVTLDSITAPTASVSMNNHKITNLAAPTQNGDAVTKEYVDDQVATITTNAIIDDVNTDSNLTAN